MNLIKCQNCGEEIKDNESYCSNCGYKVKNNSNDNIIESNDLSNEKDSIINENNYTNDSVITDEVISDEKIIVKDAARNFIKMRDVNKVRDYIMSKYEMNDYDATILAKKAQNKYGVSLSLVFVGIIVCMLITSWVVDYFTSIHGKDFVGTKWVDDSAESYIEWDCYKPNPYNKYVPGEKTKCYLKIGKTYYSFLDSNTVKVDGFSEEVRNGYGIKNGGAYTRTESWSFSKGLLYMKFTIDNKYYVSTYMYNKDTNEFVLIRETENGVELTLPLVRHVLKQVN